MRKLMSVTNDEKLLLVKLVERNHSLIELRPILDDAEIIRQQETDIAANEKKIEKWWDDISKKYNFEVNKLNCCYMNFMDGFLYTN